MWRDEGRWRVLHLEGPPGCGKSTTVTRLIEDLRHQHPVAFFFCIVGVEKQDWRDIICTWIWQLLDEKPQFTGGVFDIYTTTLGTTTPIATYFRALLWLVEQLDCPYLFLDGLDENSQLESQGLQGLRASFRDLSRHCKLFTSSRPESWIRYSLPTDDGTFVRLPVPLTSNEDDISRFLRDGLSEMEWDPATTASVHGRLSQGSRGMFLWAKLMLHHLKHQVTLIDLERSLDELPDGLDEVYARILEKLMSLPASKAHMVAKALQWMYSAIRPLTLAELEVALTIEPGSPEHAGRNRMMNFRRFVEDTCSPLLQLHEATGAVAFAHASVRQYLERLAESESPNPALSGRLSLTKGSRSPHLSAVCLTYLACDDISFVHPSSSDELYAERLRLHLAEHPFLQYASLGLWDHFPDNLDGNAVVADLDGALTRFFSTGRNTVRWVQLYQLLGGAGKRPSNLHSVFHPDATDFDYLKRYPAFRKLGATESKLFVRWDRWIAERFFNGHSCSPITIAAFFDFVDVVSEELSAGVPVDDDTILGLTPLLFAAHGDALGSVRLLLERGADPTWRSQTGYGALRYASRNCLSVLPTILSLKVPPDAAANDEGMTPLHAVCSSVGWHPAVFDGILTRTDTDGLAARDVLGRIPLHLAAGIDVANLADLMNYRRQHRHTELKPRLLATSIQEAFTPTATYSVEAWAEAWQSRLARTRAENDCGQGAAWKPPNDFEGFLDLVCRIKGYMIRELLVRSSPKNAQDVVGRTALHYATSVGVKRDPPAVTESSVPRTSGSEFQTVGADTAIKLLLENGLDASLRDNSGVSPLEIAIGRLDWNDSSQLFMAQGSEEAEDTDDDQGLTLLQDSFRLPVSSITRLSMSQTAWLQHGSSDSSPPLSHRDLAEVTLVLRSRLRTSRSDLGRDSRIQTRLVSRILDLAEYWAVTMAWVDIGRENQNPQVSLRLGRGSIRKITVAVARKEPISGSGCPPPYEDVESMGLSPSSTPATWGYRWIDEVSSHSSRVKAPRHSRIARAFKSRPSSGGGGSPRLLFTGSSGDSPYLRWRHVSKSGAPDPGVPEPPQIPGDRRLWTKTHEGIQIGIAPDRWKVWNQVWPSELYTSDALPVANDDEGRASSISTEQAARAYEETKAWLGGLKEGDTLILEPAEGFSLHGIAVFPKFGAVVYSAM